MTRARQIHVVDDDDGVRKAVTFLLRSAGFAVMSWRSGADFLAGVDPQQPACILLDVRMPSPDGLDVQRLLAEMGIAWPVVMFTGHGELTIAVQALRAGAIDFIEKPFERQSLLDVIDRAFRLMDDPGEIARQAAEAALVLAILNDHERAVLEWFAAGLTNRQVSDAMGIAPHVIEIRRASFVAKLGVSNLSAAVRLVFTARR